MTHWPRLLRFRIVSLLLLAAAALQAVPSGSVGFERGHGSAFDISTVEVATAPYQRKADQGEVQAVEPLLATKPAPRGPAYDLQPDRMPDRFGLPPQTGPPLARDVASLALAPRAPPHA